MVPVSVWGARPSPWHERLRRWSTAAQLSAPAAFATHQTQGRLGQTLTGGSSPTGIKNMGYPVGVSHILVYTTQFDTMQR